MVLVGDADSRIKSGIKEWWGPSDFRWWGPSSLNAKRSQKNKKSGIKTSGIKSGIKISRIKMSGIKIGMS